MTGSRQQAWEIRPATPEGVRFSGVRGGLEAVAARAGLRVDPAAGTLTWTSDVARRGTTVMSLPGTGVAGPDRPEVRGVHVVTLPGPVPTRTIVFADPNGRAIATSGRSDARTFDVLWPPGVLEQVSACGVEFGRESLPHAHRLQQRFPGAARHWYLTTYPWNFAVFLGPLILLAVGFLLLVGFGVVG